MFLKKHKINKAVMLSEFRVGANKADCVILNGLSTCYEIKTELDNLKDYLNNLRHILVCLIKFMLSQQSLMLRK